MKNKLSVGDILKKYNLLILLLIFVVISAILSSNFLKPTNLLNIFQQCATHGVIAIGMTMVILVGGIDLSVGAVAAFAGMVTSLAVSANYPIVLSILLGVLSGVIMGTMSGVFISIFKLPDFIVTLATMQIARGLALLITKGTPVFGLPNDFQFIGGGRISGVPVAGLLWVILTIIAAIILKFTPFGRSLFSIGGNHEAALLSGIKVRKHKIMVYLMSGALAAFAGILTASWLKTGQPTACNGYELDAIAASVIGGASLAGGIGTVIGTFGGVILLHIITNIFNLIGISSFYQQIAKGVIIVIALLLNKFVASRKG